MGSVDSKALGIFAMPMATFQENWLGHHNPKSGVAGYPVSNVLHHRNDNLNNQQLTKNRFEDTERKYRSTTRYSHFI